MSTAPLTPVQRITRVRSAREATALALGGIRRVLDVPGVDLLEWQRGKPIPAPWRPPDGLEQHDIDTRTGGQATGGCPEQQVSREWFLPGTAPQDCPAHAGGLAGFLERTVGKWFH